MNENPTAPAEMETAPMPILTAEERLQRAANYSDTLADFDKQVQEELAILQYEIQAGIIDAQDGTANEIRQALTSRIDVIAPLTSEYGSVQVANLEPGVGGMAPVGGEVAEIYVSAGQVADGDFQDLQGILVHEERHTDQVEMQSGEPVKLIVDGKEVKDDTVILEGDTETFVVDTTGFDRNDRPEAVYGEGKEIAEAIQSHSADTWNRVLTQTGDLGELQNAVWINGVEKGTLSAEQIAEEAEQTGHMFNEAFIAAQNATWAEGIESGKLTPEEVQEVADQLDIELTSEVNLAIAKVAANTRNLYMYGPRETRLAA